MHACMAYCVQNRGVLHEVRRSTCAVLQLFAPEKQILWVFFLLLFGTLFLSAASEWLGLVQVGKNQHQGKKEKKKKEKQKTKLSARGRSVDLHLTFRAHVCEGGRKSQTRDEKQIKKVEHLTEVRGVAYKSRILSGGPPRP